VTPPRQKSAYAAFNAFVAAKATATVDVVEYFAASLEHFFITAETVEIAALDSGMSAPTVTLPRDGSAGASWRRAGNCQTSEVA